MRHDEQPPELPETVDNPAIPTLNFEPYSFTINLSMHTYDGDDEDDDTTDFESSSAGDWDEWNQEFDYPSSNIIGQFSISMHHHDDDYLDDDDHEDDDTSDSESSAGDWDEWDQEFDYPSSNIIGRFSISTGEGTVTVDVNGGESFNDTKYANDPLIEETILDNLKTREYERAADDEEPDICAICQGEFENQETLATLHCGHEYHADCITKWLMRKNACPFCNRDGYKLQ